ncbi:MAG: alpha/beta fold hydrolase [Thermaerobacter sp.]|nr:alpha/beta fold hydrolase [Thermaerobacter sp.]
MMREVPVAGTTLRVEEEGAGPAIILLHAGVADRRMWDPQVAFLRGSHRVIRWDLRGFGETPNVPGPFSYAADVLAVMDALEVKEAVLIGCSMGGAAAVRVALTSPERIQGLVLVGSGLHGFDHPELEPPIVQDLIAAEEAKDYERLMALEFKLWIVGLERQEADLDRQFLALTRDMFAKAFQPANGAEPQDALTSDVERLSDLTLPVLLIVGGEDLQVIKATAEFIASRVRGARLETIEGAAHLPNLEHPKEFNAILGDWLEV